MPDTIKGLTNVTKDNSDFFAGIKSLAEYIVQEGKLVHNGVAWHETRRKLFSCKWLNRYMKINLSNTFTSALRRDIGL